MKKGSALLIVLGMISFMLFSGIAFSVYMRQTRLPSSFLRRTTVTRQLTKAALAEAIKEIDAAIGDDPHPNVRRNDTENGDSDDETADTFGNYWNHRVYVRKRQYVQNDNGFTGNTVSTLSLEGLAYLPPSLINEARYYSRHTPTAGWQRFDFDAGRFAYCAIDVSDYFDVNRALADRPRSSAASRRVTLAHIFEKNGNGGLHGEQQDGEAEAWDAWLQDDANVRNVHDVTDKITFGSKMPMVSLADFNLLLSTESFELIKSPFVEYIASGGDAFYPTATGDDDDQITEAYRSMTFVTDSLFRKPTTNEKLLSSSENQPFENSLMVKNSSGKTFDSVIDGAYKSRSSLWDEYYLTFLSRLGMCSLCDYLDEDSLPISLAIPTCERMPMVCAIRPEFTGGKLTIVKIEDDNNGNYYNEDGTGPAANTGNSRMVSSWLEYRLSGADLGGAGCTINVATVFPFPKKSVGSDDSFTIDGGIELFFTRSGKEIPLITGEPDDAFSGGNDSRVDICSTPWINGIIRSAFAYGAGVPIDQTTPVGNPWRVNRLNDIGSELPVDGNSDRYLFRVLRKWEQQLNPTTGLWVDVPGTDEFVESSMTAKYPYINESGIASDMLPLIRDEADAKLQLNLSVRVRIKNKDGKAVDLVPACMSDDSRERLAANTGRYSSNYRQRFGDGGHFLKFTFNEELPISKADFEAITGNKSINLTLDAKTLVCADPRYNHSPYNWFSVGETEVDQAWTANNNSNASGRDGDYYMTTSDQGYLQSIYELAFLPRTTEPTLGSDGRGAEVSYGNLTLLGDYSEDKTKHPGEFGRCINAKNMWKTYNPFPFNGNDADAFDDLGFVAGLNGLMVNPYSESPEVLAAAFANTPHDWRVASTNETANPACKLGADAFNKKYAWNAYSSENDNLLPWNAVLDIADNFQSRIRNNPSSSWDDVFRGLWSGDGERRIAGVNLDDVTPSVGTKFKSVDRKFLYGFWHDCFAVNQQLFLIFVRAEPMMMGGGIAGNAPPQLSSRAVALVWRDPEQRKTSSSSSSGAAASYMPHGLRILFYHPLD